MPQYLAQLKHFVAHSQQGTLEASTFSIRRGRRCRHRVQRPLEIIPRRLCGGLRLTRSRECLIERQLELVAALPLKGFADQWLVCALLPSRRRLPSLARGRGRGQGTAAKLGVHALELCVCRHQVRLKV